MNSDKYTVQRLRHDQYIEDITLEADDLIQQFNQLLSNEASKVSEDETNVSMNKKIKLADEVGNFYSNTQNVTGLSTRPRETPCKT